MKITLREKRHNLLSLANFIDFFGIHPVMNDQIIENIEGWEYYSIQKYDWAVLESFLKDHLRIAATSDCELEDLQKLVEENYQEFLDYYQIQYHDYLIISEDDAEIVKKYLDFDIMYNEKIDMYLWCIDRIVGSPDLLLTSFPLPIELRELEDCYAS